MRNAPLSAIASLALLIGCSEQESLTSALTPGRPSFVTYTASAGAPAVLGALNGSSYTIAYDINDKGTITGGSGDGASVVGWATGTAPNPQSTTPFVISVGGNGHAINSVGQVAGDYLSHAALWTPQKGGGYILTEIGTLPFFTGYNSVALGLNASGQVVGTYAPTTNPNSTKCFLWTPGFANATTGSVVDIPGFLGSDFCIANDINLAGQIAGASNLSAGGGNHAFVRSGGVTIDLQPGAPADDYSYGTSINNAGQVAGYHVAPIGTSSAAVWTPTGGVWSSASDLGTPTLSGQSGTITSVAQDINDAGYVVGTTTDQTQHIRAFFWQGGAFTELPDGTLAAQPNALTNVLGNRVIVTGGDLDQLSGARRGLRWTVTLKR